MRFVRLFLDLMTSGGPAVMIPLFLTGVVAWYIGIDRLLFMRRIDRARARFLASLDSLLEDKPPPRFGVESYDRFVEQLRACAARCRGDKAVRGLFREFLVRTMPELERGFSAMTAWITVAPLLGLLGTVMGMMHTFKVITIFGVGNPNLMAEGISIALITTEAGLTVAFPAMLFHNHLVGRKNLVRSQLLRDGEVLVNRLALSRARQPAEESDV